MAAKMHKIGVPILVTSKMTKRFGGLVAVDALDLSVRENSIHSVIGPNGAGKTTVFNCIMEFYAPDDGEIAFLGERIDGLTPDRVAVAGISRTYQNIRLFNNITAVENILVGMHIHLKSKWWGAILRTKATKQDEDQAEADAIEILKFVGLSGRGDLLARNLAYGDQRRLEIGRALATRPKLLMLDEPMAALDPMIRADLQTELKEIFRSLRKTVVLVTHDLAEAAFFGDEIVLLNEGRMVQRGDLQTLVREPADPFVTRFIKAQRRDLGISGESS